MDVDSYVLVCVCVQVSHSEAKPEIMRRRMTVIKLQCIAYRAEDCTGLIGLIFNILSLLNGCE